jgi:transcriptional regulator with XRE-family HTH domain
MTHAMPPGPRGAKRRERSYDETVQIKRFISALNQAQVVHHTSQRGLCDLLGITVGTLTKYFRGEVLPTKVGLGIQSCLADALGVTLDALMNYYQTGEYATAVSIDEVESWIRSEAGQQDLPVLMASLQAAGQRWVEGAEPEIPATKPQRWDWPINEVRDSGVSDRFREKIGLSDEALELLCAKGSYDDELVEAFSVACNYEIEAVREAFEQRKSIG